MVNNKFATKISIGEERLAKNGGGEKSPPAKKVHRRKESDGENKTSDEESPQGKKSTGSSRSALKLA